MRLRLAKVHEVDAGHREQDLEGIGHDHALRRGQVQPLRGENTDADIGVAFPQWLSRNVVSAPTTRRVTSAARLPNWCLPGRGFLGGGCRGFLQ